jgi:hypothetical protein
MNDRDRLSKMKKDFAEYLSRLELNTKELQERNHSLRNEVKNISDQSTETDINTLNSFIENNNSSAFIVYLRKMQDNLKKYFVYAPTLEKYLSVTKRSNKKNKKIIQAINSFQSVYKDKFFVDMLITAATENKLSLIQHLLNDKNKIDNYNFLGYTALCIAADKNYLTLAQMLLENGADINKPNGNGDTPLYISIKQNNFAIIALLLRNQAKMEKGFTLFSLSLKEFRKNVKKNPDTVEHFPDIFSSTGIVRQHAKEHMQARSNHPSDNYSSLINIDPEEEKIKIQFNQFEKVYLDALTPKTGSYCLSLDISKIVTGYLGILVKPEPNEFKLFKPHSRKRKIKNTDTDQQIDGQREFVYNKK